MNFKFSLFRMFMAVTVFCMAFAFVKLIGAPWPICPWLIGVPMALLMLLAKIKDKRAITTALMVCGIGVVIGEVMLAGSIRMVRIARLELVAIPNFALMGLLLTCFLRYFVIGFAKWHYNIRHSYWEEYDAKSSSAESQEINQSKLREPCP